MKKNIFITLLLCTTSFMVAQKKLKVGDNHFQINPSAALQVESKTKGFLPPQMSVYERDRISNPAIGLQVYCTDCNPPGLYNFDGVKWVLVGMTNAVPYTGATDNVDLGGYGLKVQGLTIGNASGDTNTAIGKNVLTNNSTDGGNTAVGASALTSNTSGTANTVVGYSSLSSNTDGSGNIAVGVSSLSSNTNGGSNIAMGNSTLSNNTSGGNNLAVGNNTLASNSTGNYNLAVGNSSLYDSNTGSFNIGLGLMSGKGLTNGISNIFIGNSDDSGSGLTTGSNNVIIGSNITGLPSILEKNIVLADGTGTIRAQHDGTTGWDLKGSVKGVTEPATDNSTKLATTEFVGTAVTTAVTNATSDASATVKGKIQLAGDLEGTAALPTVSNAAVIGKVLTGFASGAGTVDATDSVLGAIQKVDGNVALKAPLESAALTGIPTAPTATAGTNTTQLATTEFVGTAVTTAVTNATPDASTTVKGKIQLAGELSGTAALPTVTNAAVIGKVLTGFASGAGTVNASDSVLGAIQKVDGNVALKAPLASAALTGIPTAPTATAGTNTTQLATTEFVGTAVTNATPDASATVKGKIQLAGELSGTAALPTVTNAAVIGKVLTGFASGAGTVNASDSVLGAIQKVDGNVALKAPLASAALTGIPTAPTATAGTNTTQLATTAFVGTAVTNATPDASATVKGKIQLAGELSGTAALPTVTNAAVIGKVLTGFASGAGTVNASDSVLGAIQKVDGNVALKAPLASAALTGVPTAPTATAGTNTTQLATTAFVGTALTNNAVPYTGATKAVDLGGFDLKVNTLTIGRGNSNIGSNTAIGANVLNVNTTGSSNTGIGVNALKFNTTGYVNTAVGVTALNFNTTGFSNTAVGSSALHANTTGDNNTAFGFNSLYSVTDVGSRNIGIGSSSGDGLTTGSGNIFIGNSDASVSGITTGSNNVIIGSNVSGLTAALQKNIILADGAGTIRAQHDGTTGWDLKGSVKGVTEPATDNSTKLATTEFVGTAVTNATPDASATVKGKIQLAGELSGTAALPTVTNAAVIGKVLTGFASGAGTVNASDSVLGAIQKVDGNVALKAPLASAALTGIPTAPTATAGTNTTQLATTAFVGTAVTNATPDASATVKGKIQLAGELSGTAALPTVTNAAVIGKVLTGFASGAGTVNASDSVLGAIQKVDGNVALKAPLASAALTGIPTAPTATAGTNTTQLATTAFVGTAVTNATPDATTSAKGKIQLAGDLEGTAASPTVTNAAVLGKVLTGFTGGSGEILATDTVLGAIQKLNGNSTLKAPLASPQFTGTPYLPEGTTGFTQITGDKSTKLATTAFVGTAITNNAVPYTGATKAVDLGPYDLSVNGLTVGRGNNINMNNTAIGYSALSSSTDNGKQNTAVGYSTLSSNTDGGGNTAVGSSALFSNTLGGGNTAVGDKALSSNTEGGNNIALGYDSGKKISNGSNNIFIGNNGDSTVGLTTGSNNVIIGSDITLPATLNNNIILADGAGTIRAQHDGTTGWDLKGSVTGVTEPATDNSTKLATTAFVGRALTNNAVPYTGATKAVDLGGFDLMVNTLTIGRGNGNLSSNTVIGANVLNANTTGYDNTAFGSEALKYNTSGYLNTGIGLNALNSNTTGYANTAVGRGALNANTTGYNNTAFGAYSLRSVTSTTSTGSKNIGIGSYSGDGLTTGSGNIFIGNSDTSTSGITTGSNNVIIGSNITALPSSTSNSIILADGAGNIRAENSSGTWNFRGSVSGVTEPATENSVKLASTAFVNNAVASKAPSASPILTGVPTAPTATAGTKTTQLATTEFVTNAVTTALPYKAWIGIVSQSGSGTGGIPTANTLFNNTGLTPTFSYNSVGIYYMSFGGGLTTGKVAVFMGSTSNGGGAILISTITDTTQIRLVSRNIAGAYADGLYNSVFLEIRIYN